MARLVQGSLARLCGYCGAVLNADANPGTPREFCLDGCKAKFWAAAKKLGARTLRRRRRRQPAPLCHALCAKPSDWPGLENFLAAKAANGGRAHQVGLEHHLAGWA